MLANITDICLLELYTWKTFVGFVAVLVLAPVLIVIVEKITDWWYWRKNKDKKLVTKIKFV